MDPQVIAALISTPVAVLAAVTAYAAGKAQGRGTVDAVRRQHQRDAYATLHAATSKYLRDTSLASRSRAARPEGPSAQDEPTRERVRAALSSLGPLVDAASLVALEGPDHLADLATDIHTTAIGVYAALAVPGFTDGASLIAGRTVAEDHDWQILAAELSRFTEVARAHLNGHPPPPIRRWAAHVGIRRRSRSR